MDMNTISSGVSAASTSTQFGRNRHSGAVQAGDAPRRNNPQRSRLTGAQTDGITRNLFEDTFINLPSSRQRRLEALVRKASIPNGKIALNEDKNGVSSAAYELA